MAELNLGRKFNVANELLGKHPDIRGDKVAIYCRDEKVTYRELEQNVNRFANVLKGLGLKPKDRVMIIAPDSPDVVYAFLGSIKHGAFPVPVNTMLTEDDYVYMLKDSEARLLITTADSVASRIETGKSCEKLFLDSSFHDLLESASTETESYLANRDDIAFWLYSSGSTGKPKGTPHKQISMLFTADTYAKTVLDICENDVCFSASKMFFAYGLGNGISFPLRFGASVVILSDRPTPENVLDTIFKFKPTVFFGVPTLYNSLLKKLTGESMSWIRICTSAGEALPPEIYKKWKEKTGLEILDGIGSTEALHIFISNRPGKSRPGTSGWPVQGYEAKIVDDDGREVSPGETGHLIIRGESVTPGYWRRPEENEKRVLPDGWFKTGDMYSQNDGYFTYQGRGDDMLKSGGLWVSPMDIEQALLEHEAVYECAAVGREIEGLVKPFVYVVLNEGWDQESGDQLKRKLLDFVAEKLPKFKRPWGIFFVNDLPKTATGKIQRFKLRS
ncbi:MAG: benzoate-CoA ligase family protein [Desulfomonilaceae bacterium]